MVCELGKPIARSTTESTSELFTHLVPRSLSNSRNSSAAGSGGIQLFETFRSEKCACQICTWHTFPGLRYNENPTVSAEFSSGIPIAVTPVHQLTETHREQRVRLPR